MSTLRPAADPVVAGRGAALPRRPAAHVLRAVAPLVPALGGIALVALVVLAVSPSTFSSDSWLALVAGREIVRHGLPSRDHLVVLAHGRRWVDQQWLGQLVVYGLWRLGGLRACAIFGAIASLVAFALPVVRNARTAAGGYAQTLLPVVALVSCVWALQVRTQLLAVVLYAVLLSLLLSDPSGTRRRTLAALPLLALWANVHGSAVLAAAIVFLYALILIRRGARARAVPYLLAPALLLASPYGLSLLGYYRLLLIDPPFRGLVNEWQPAGLSPYFAGFYVLFALALVAAFRFRRRLDLFELALLALAAAAAFDALRNVVWFAVALLFVLPRFTVGGRRFRDPAAGALAVGLAAVVLAVLGVIAARPDGYYTAHGFTGPAAAATRHAVETTSGPVYADAEHADWLLWRVPEARGRVAFDSRFELLSRPTLVRLAALAKTRANVLSTLHPYSLAVVSPSVGRSLARDGWGRVAYSDDTTAIVRSRRDGRGQ